MNAIISNYYPTPALVNFFIRFLLMLSFQLLPKIPVNLQKSQWHILYLTGAYRKYTDDIILSRKVAILISDSFRTRLLP
jgi:hypothetical protein